MADKKTKTATKSRSNLSFYLDSDTQKALRELATAEGCSLAALARDVFSAFIQAKDKGKCSLVLRTNLYTVKRERN